VVFSNGPPDIPLSFAASSPAVGQVLLSWGAVANSTRFEVSVNFGNSGGPVLQTLPANSSITLVTGLSPGTSYHWFVRACNDAGCSAWTGPIGQTPDGSAAPIELDATINASTSAITFSDTTHNNILTGGSNTSRWDGELDAYRSSYPSISGHLYSEDRNPTTLDGYSGASVEVKNAGAGDYWIKIRNVTNGRTGIICINSPDGDNAWAIVGCTGAGSLSLGAFTNPVGGWTVSSAGKVSSMPLPASLVNADLLFSGLFNKLPDTVDDWTVGSKMCLGASGGFAGIGSDFRAFFFRPLDLFSDFGLGTTNCTSAGTYSFVLADPITRRTVHSYAIDWDGSPRSGPSYTYTNGLGFGPDTAGHAWNIWSANGSNVWDWHQDYVDGYLHYRFKVLDYASFYCSGSCRFHNIWNKDPTSGFELADVVAHDTGVFPESNQNNHVYQVDIQWIASGYHGSVFDITDGVNYSDQDYAHGVTATTYDSWTWGTSLWSSGVSYRDEESTDHMSQWLADVYGEGATEITGGGGDVRTDALPVMKPTLQ